MFLSFLHHSWAEVSSIVCLESMMEFRGLFVALQKHALFETYLNLWNFEACLWHFKSMLCLKHI